MEDPLKERIETRLSRFVGEPLDLDAWEEELTAITGTERYRSLRYEELESVGVRGLLVPTNQKAHAPPFLRFNVGISNETQDIDFNFGTRLTALDVGKTGAEVRLQGDLGARLGAGAEYYFPFIGRSVFVAPRAFYVREFVSEFENDDLVASRRDRSTGVGIDLGFTTSRNAELRLGYQLADVESTVRIGDPSLPEPAGREELVRARFVYDGHNAPVIPTRGVRTTASIEWYEDAPDAERAFGIGRVELSAFVPRGAGDAIYVLGRAGASFGSTPPFLYDFALGGPFRLSAFALDEFRGDNALYGSVGYLREISRLPDIMGGPVYLTGLVETGSAFDDFDDADFRFSAGGGILMETAIGPLFAIASGGTGGNFKFYFTLGRFFDRAR